jgi:uncharacterized protein YdcH (DUF465 family)
VEARAPTTSVLYSNRRTKMVTKRKKSKKLKKLEDEHQYLDKKVAQLTKDRLKDRSSESKEVLTRLKRTKLMIKDAIARAKATLTR